MIGEEREFKGVRGEWQVVLVLRGETLSIETVSTFSMEHYTAEMTEEDIRNDKNFDFLFDKVSTLYSFMETSFTELEVQPGKVSFLMEVPIGKITKKMELAIPIHRREVDQAILTDLKFKKMQAELEELR